MAARRRRRGAHVRPVLAGGVRLYSGRRARPDEEGVTEGEPSPGQCRQNGIVEQTAPRPRHGSLAPAGLLLALILAAGCAASSSSPTPSPTGPPLSQDALKLAVLDAVGGRLDYCDPDLYPIAR